jgi:membrane protein involved in D-alanine export
VRCLFNLAPYGSLLYFGALLYVAAPTVAVRLLGRFWRTWMVVAVAFMLVVQYWVAEKLWGQVTVNTLWLVLGYAVFEWFLAFGFTLIRARIKNRWIYYSALTLALAPLLAVKFAPLFAHMDQIGFLGISYLTFRALDVIFCVRDKLIKSLSVFQYFAFLLFFPTVSSGPIDRYNRFAADWKRERTRAEFFQDLEGAVRRIFLGLLYNFILAVLIKKYWLDPFASRQGFVNIASYGLAYSSYLFFNFAGYSNFATGVSYLLGVHTPDNFRMPFLAKSIRDFWDRWHISLSYWFRDHIYSRFVFAATKGHWFKNQHVGSYLGFALAMGLMGIWHGTQLHYIVYGFYHAGLLITQDRLSRWNKQHKLWGKGKLWTACAVGITFILVCFGFLIFSGRLF